ncbi:MAG: hypothetical protein ACI9MF_002434 [Gammaproteobacteria bacterium]|jgi:hypothetical protein
MASELNETPPSTAPRLSWVSSTIVLNIILIFNLTLGLLIIIASIWMISTRDDDTVYFFSMFTGFVSFVLGCGIWFRIEIARKILLSLYWINLIILGLILAVGIPWSIFSDAREFSISTTGKSIVQLVLFIIVVKCLSAENIVKQFPANKKYVATMDANGVPLAKNSERSTLFLSIILSFTIGLPIGAIVVRNAYVPYSASNEPVASKEIKAVESTVRIVVASKDLFPGDVINDTTAALRKTPDDYIMSYHILAEDYKTTLRGKKLNRSLQKGEAILSHFVD